MNDIIKASDIDSADEIIGAFRTLPHFTYGEGLQLIYYTEAAIAYEKYKDVQVAYDKCLKGIYVIHPNFTFDEVKYLRFQKITYNLVISLACYSYSIGKKELSLQILHDLLLNIESNYINTGISSANNSEYHKKAYLSTMINLTNYYLEERDFEQSEKYIDLSLKFSQEQDCYSFLANIYYDKFSMHFNKKEITKAVETLEQCVFLINITKNNSVLLNIKKVMEEYSNEFQLELAYVEEEYILLPLS